LYKWYTHCVEQSITRKLKFLGQLPVTVPAHHVSPSVIFCQVQLATPIPFSYFRSKVETLRTFGTGTFLFLGLVNFLLYNDVTFFFFFKNFHSNEDDKRFSRKKLWESFCAFELHCYILQLEGEGGSRERGF